MTFQDGKIITESKYYQEARYDIANEKIAVVADGSGGLASYRVNDGQGDCLPSFLSLDLAVNGERLSPYLSKKVEMLGRMQKVTLDTPSGKLTIKTFLTKDVNGVFFLLKGDMNFDLSLNCRGAKSADRDSVTFVKGENFLLSSSSVGDWVQANDSFYTSATGEIRLLLSFMGEEKEHRTAFADFSAYYDEVLNEIASIKIPSSVTTEEEKAMYLAATFTALENHKTIGDFRAFAAGSNYINPVRTYYRDSYFTVLPLIGSHPDLVRDEILTLARGVGEDGSCPSAVKSDFTLFWGDHYDSPSFFIAEICSYVSHTGDRAILDEKVNGTTLLEKVGAILDRLDTLTDETGLIYKTGDYNKRDWADEVNRGGYVTFVEAMYYRALTCAAALYAGRDDDRAALCRKRAEKVRSAINEILFDEEKGYYLNYKTATATESNLSIDTVFTLLFGIADEERAVGVIDNMERLLETKGGEEVDDFGVMCVYPPYSLPRAACHKSARLYDYHNGANWCYLTAMYAYAKSLYGRDWREPLVKTFRYMVSHGNYTYVEYFSPCCKTGSALQAWSAATAFVFNEAGKENFFKLS